MPLYAFDGTWNDSRAPDRDKLIDTNVYKFFKRYDESYQRFYLDGVGSRKGSIGKWVGGLTGAGRQVRVDENFKHLLTCYASGLTDIDVIGYSRGATIARMFVNKIANEFFKIKDSSGKPLEEPPIVRFLGLFDTVASLGVPWTDNEHDFVPTIPELVERTYHAMALDEIRETFGLERCIGLRDNICEVWFRGGHADIGGNATFHTVVGERVANRKRSNIALNWMLSKATSCGLPIRDREKAPTDQKAKVTSALDNIPVGKVGTKSRRIHIGDLVHYSVDCNLDTTGINGNLLRRIDVPTRIEDVKLEASAEIMHWRPVFQLAVAEIDQDLPQLIELSSRRYPFDVGPARRWREWLQRWQLDDKEFAARLDEFWAPTNADRALAWDIYVELQTRITTQKLTENDGDEQTALKSVATIFDTARAQIRAHGIASANVATLLTKYLNQEIRPFTTIWHSHSIEGRLSRANKNNLCKEFRQDLVKLQPALVRLAQILSETAGASISGTDHSAFIERD